MIYPILLSRIHTDCDLLSGEEIDVIRSLKKLNQKVFSVEMIYFGQNNTRIKHINFLLIQAYPNDKKIKGKFHPWAQHRLPVFRIDRAHATFYIWSLDVISQNQHHFISEIIYYLKNKISIFEILNYLNVRLLKM